MNETVDELLLVIVLKFINKFGPEFSFLGIDFLLFISLFLRFLSLNFEFCLPCGKTLHEFIFFQDLLYNITNVFLFFEHCEIVVCKHHRIASLVRENFIQNILFFFILNEILDDLHERESNFQSSVYQFIFFYIGKKLKIVFWWFIHRWKNFLFIHQNWCG